MTTWIFSPVSAASVRRDPNETELFKTEQVGEGEYAGTDALVREVIQNSLDAGHREEPVRVRFALHSNDDMPAKDRLSHYFSRLEPALEFREIGFAEGVPQLSNGFLVCEDFGTSGLAGDPNLVTDPPKGAQGRQDFFWFWRNIGRSGKTGDDLGRWGLGNRHYRLLLSVCRLIVECFLPNETESNRRFRNLLDDERLMNRIFERFVRNFARRHYVDAKVGVSHIKWFGEWDEEFESLLPLMKTDVTLERLGRTTILDCKYYKEALISSFDKARVRSGHLYQLNAYLQNSGFREPTRVFEGVLLYPSVKSQSIHAKFKLLGKDVKIESINLDQPWQGIESDLKQILV